MGKSRLLFLISSFVAGFCLMTVELAASRIVAPYIGSSIYTWTSVIGVILLGLSVGYYSGGYLSDKFPDKNIVFWEYIFSSVGVIAIPFISPLSETFARASLPLPLTIFLVSLSLFFIPSVFLGALSPSILKRCVNSLGQVARNAGTLSALWSVGSIAGTFLTGFVFIGYIGSKETFLAVGAVIAFNSIFFSGSRKQLFSALAILSVSILLLFFLPKAAASDSGNIIFSKDSDYYRIKVADGSYQGAGDSRILFLDFDSHSVESRSGKFLGNYPDMYPLFSVFNKNIRNIFVIGGGSYSLPKYLSSYYPDSSVTVAELDPEVKKTAENYFGLDKYNIATVISDGRMALNKDQNKYDLIFEDAFNSFISLPWHLTTEEFSQIAKSHLKNGGIYAVNFISATDGQNADFFRSMLKTFKSVFPNSYVFSTGDLSYYPQSIALIGINSDSHESAGVLKLEASLLKNGAWLSAHLYDSNKFSDTGGIVLTDNFAPVERLMIPIMNQYFKPYSDFYYSFLGSKT